MTALLHPAYIVYCCYYHGKGRLKTALFWEVYLTKDKFYLPTYIILRQLSYRWQLPDAITELVF